MKHWTHALTVLRRALSPSPEDTPEDAAVPAPEAGDARPRLEGPPAPLPSQGHTLDDCPEFADLLETIGAEAPPPSVETVLARKDIEIAELRRNLAALRPLGDRLAEWDKALLAREHEEEAEGSSPDAEEWRLLARKHTEARSRCATLEEQLREASALAERSAAAETKLRASLRETKTAVASRNRALRKLNRALEKRDAALARATDRLDTLRARHEERSRTAADRWRQILELRRSNKALAAEVAALREAAAAGGTKSPPR